MFSQLIRTTLDDCSLETDQYSCRKKGLLKGGGYNGLNFFFTEKIIGKPRDTVTKRIIDSVYKHSLLR